MVPGLLPGPLMGVQTAACQVLLIEDNLQTLLRLFILLLFHSVEQSYFVSVSVGALLWIIAAVLIKSKSSAKHESCWVWMSRWPTSGQDDFLLFRRDFLSRPYEASLRVIVR